MISLVLTFITLWKSMRAKVLSKRTLLPVALVSCLLCAVVLGYMSSLRNAPRISSVPTPVHTVASPQQNVIDLPVRLKIPNIGVDAAVEYMGLTAAGAMDTPKGPDNVGWYKLGQRPGAIGSAVITGHFGWKNNLPAAFDNVHKLKAGDILYVEDEKGASATFIVRELRQYGKNDDTKDVFGSSDGQAHLNLITCEGTWSAASKSYSNRLVVFSDKK